MKRYSLKSTLLPYTTLFRSNEGEVTSPEGFKEAYQTIVEGGWNGLGGNPEFGGMGMPKTLVAQFEEMMQGARSEEHTSELQSRPHLVCRLLLEKKKT